MKLEYYVRPARRLGFDGWLAVARRPDGAVVAHAWTWSERGARNWVSRQLHTHRGE